MSDTKRATVKDIANELHISIGTVSKALTGKRGISDEMRESIEEAAKRLGYSVNRQAQCLARKPIRIGVVYPAAWEEFYGPLIGGMKEAMESLRDYNAVTSCYKYLTERKIPNNTILIEPSPIFRSQLSKNSLLQK